MQKRDVIVVGLGAMGAAVCCELARRGLSVLGIDRFEPPHGLGSTHGRTRIIREAYFEHPLYVPMVQRAFELWSELEELTGAVLYRRTGGVMVGPPDGMLVRGVLASARAHGLDHEELDADEVRRRFPGLMPDPDHLAIFEPRAGMLLPEPAMRTMLGLARGHGAELRLNMKVVAWHVARDGSVVLQTPAGELSAPRVVFAAGPWLGQLMDAERSDTPLPLPLTVERQVSHWFEPAPGTHAFGPAQCPIGIWEYAPARYIYTFPHDGHGVKAGIHHDGAIVDPDHVERDVSMAEEARMQQLLETCMPGAAHRAADSVVCLYTNTPDGHFIIDHHPVHEQVMVVSACSGHGFKFAPTIGEVVTDLLLEGTSAFDLAPFALSRFGA